MRGEERAWPRIKSFGFGGSNDEKTQVPVTAIGEEHPSNLRARCRLHDHVPMVRRHPEAPERSEEAGHHRAGGCEARLVPFLMKGLGLIPEPLQAIDSIPNRWSERISDLEHHKFRSQHRRERTVEWPDRGDVEFTPVLGQ